MNNRDILNLYEAYVEIYDELDEEKKMKGKDPCWKGYEMVGTKNKGGKEVPNCVPKEEVDLHDIVLSHLLDEGYAETLEAAEKIMMNMSEEWMESIISEAKVDEPLNPVQRLRARNKRLEKDSPQIPIGYQTAARRSKHETSRGKKKVSGQKTNYDNQGNMNRSRYRQQQFKRTGNDLYKD
jgi:hypothetical protein